MSVRSTLARNTAFNAAGRLWEAVVGLVLVPYIWSFVGESGWGLWALVSFFTGYVALFDFGVSSGFAKYVAEHAARKEHDAISSVVSTGFFFYLGLGALLVAVGWPCVNGLIRLTVEVMSRLYPDRADAIRTAPSVSTIRFLFRWGLVLFAVSNCVAPFTAIQTGLQRMGVTNLLSFAASLVKIVTTVLFLKLGMGVRGLMYANAIVLAAFGLSSCIAAFVLAPGLRVSPWRMRRRIFGKLFGFGWRTQVSKLSNLVMFQTDKAVVGLAFANWGLIALYDIGVMAANKMRQIPVLLLGALIPAASDLDARGEHDRLRRLYLLSSKYVAAVTVPLAAFVMGAAGPLMRTWMGTERDYAVATWVLRIMAFGYVANIVPGAGVSVVLGKGRADLQMKAGLISMVSNIALTIVLYFAIGFWGIPIATAASMFISWLWFTRAVAPVIGVGAVTFFRACALWPALAVLPGFVACACTDVFGAGIGGRVPNAGVVLFGGVVLAGSYLLLIRLTPFLDAFDVAFLEDTLRLKHIPGFRTWTRRMRGV
ncbi:MAG TPA: oligosaccharide flippase family protein [Candidatus Hydrogenedentes bacterium]|nr:oligosaccharide flippase family protein [Candidatus Hydrogenedentota bacterium]